MRSRGINTRAGGRSCEAGSGAIDDTDSSILGHILVPAAETSEVPKLSARCNRNCHVPPFRSVEK